MRKPVAVIILNWNGSRLLRQFLPSVVANTSTEIADVFVADNGSTDDSLEILAKEFPTVKVLSFPCNYGFAEGYNQAIAQIGYEYSLLLNSDVETPAGWLEPLYNFISSRASVAAVQPKILSYTLRNYFEYAGASGGFIDEHGYPFCRGRIFSTVEPDMGQYDDPINIFWATGAAMLVRTSVYQQVGGMDKDFFAHMEEIDLCWRIKQAGHEIMVVPQSAVYHLGGGSLPASNPRKTYLNFRNNLLLLHKNLPMQEGSRLVTIRMIYDAAAWLMFVLKGEFGNAKAVIRAHNDFRRMRVKYTRFPAVSILPATRFGFLDIIVDYYLRGKKRFSQL